MKNKIKKIVKKMILKKHIADNKLMISLVDSDLIGKKFEEGEKILDMTSDFYKGEKTTEADALKEFKKAYMLNAVGKKTIEFLIKNHIITNLDVLKIDNIPFAIIVFFDK